MLEKERRKLDDAGKRIRELRQALDNKERDRASAMRRADGLQSKCVSLEAEMRLAGLSVPAAANAGM